MRHLVLDTTIGLATCLVLGATACAGAAGVERAASSASSLESAAEPAPALHPVALAQLSDAREAGELSEGAIIQMLAFRERVYLPFRYRQGIPIDGRGWLASQELDDVRAGFVRLGDDGQAVLERCVREAAEERVGGVHLAGDDLTLMGRACLDMLARAYGSGALTTLIGFAREAPTSPTATLLQRATLTLLPTVAPAAELPGASSGEREWRVELAAWSAWLKQRGALNLGGIAIIDYCDDTCEGELLRAWIEGAAEHLVMPGIEAPEPRYVSTVRQFVRSHPERWVPWLSEASKGALFSRDIAVTLSTALLVDLWAVSAAEAYPDYFRRIVLPTLVGAIQLRDVGAPYSRPLTPSEFVIDTLHHATGVSFPTPACEATPTETTVRSCLIDQVRAWGRYQAMRTWPI